MEKTNDELLITDKTYDTIPYLHPTEKNQDTLKTTENNEMYKEHRQPLSWFQRTFKPMEKGSQRGAIFLCIMTAFGTGVFTLHHLFIYCGLIYGTLLVIFVTFAYIYNAFVTIQASQQMPQCNSYSALIQKSLGIRARQFFDVCTAFGLFIAATGGLLAFSKLFYVNFHTLIWHIFSFVPQKHQTLEFFCTRAVWVIGVFMFLIVSQRDLNVLRYVSFFSLCMYLLTLVVMSFQLPQYIEQQKKDHDYTQNWTDFDIQGSFVSFGLLLTAYNFSTQYYGVKAALHNPVVYRQQKVFYRAYVIVAIFYYSIAVVSYWSLGQNTTLDLFVMRDAVEGSADIPMKVVRTCLLVGIILCAGLNLYPIKAIVDENHMTNTREKNMLISLTLTLVPVIAASMFNNVTHYMTLGGSFGCLTITFIFPAFVAIKEKVYSDGSFQKWFLIIFTIVISILGITATVINIINF